MADISIEFSDPYGVYYPGSQVVGTAVLTLCKPLKARAVYVSINGRAQTHWTESHTETIRNADGSSDTRTRTETYSACVTYIRGESVVWAEDRSNNKLAVGQHRFPFSFVLPLNCAPSFEGCHGYIRYEVNIEVDRAWKFNKNNRRLFTVAPTFDLNSVPQALSPVISKVTSNTGMVLFRNGKISLEANIPKMGFVPGETIVVDTTVFNDSKKPIVRAQLKLVQHSHYLASHGSYDVAFSDNLSCRHHCTHSREEYKPVTRSEKNLNIPPRSKGQIQLYVVVPPVVSSFNLCPIITVDYLLELKVYNSSTVNSKVSTQSPILVGTVPVMLPTTTVVQQTVHPSAPHMGPPAYEESVYGTAGTTKNIENAEAFAPRYAYYPNLNGGSQQPSAPPIGFSGGEKVPPYPMS